MAGTPSLAQSHFRNGNDDGNEAAYTFLAALDATAVLNTNTNYILRLGIVNSGTATATGGYQWQYNKNGAGWNDITTTSSVVKSVDSTNITGNGNCTQRITTESFLAANKGQCETGTTGSIILSNTPTAMETCLPMQVVAADVSQGDTIEYRVTSTTAIPITYAATGTFTVNVVSGSNLRTLMGAGI